MVQPSSLYLLPKLHKMSSLDSLLVGRPIAACHFWITTRMSVWLADLLNQCLKEYPTVVTDRGALVRELQQLRINRDDWLLVFDVESLYPNVEHTGCIEACVEAVHSQNCYTKPMVEEFLKFVLQNKVVSVQGKHYLQVFGGAMGTNCMPPAAQLYPDSTPAGEEVGECCATKDDAFPSVFRPFPSVFRRFIDDGFVVFQGNKQKLLSFVQMLNSILPDIKITHSFDQAQVELLDLIIYKSGGESPDGKVGLKVRTHQKELNKYLYIPHHSHHHLGMFRSFIQAELIRYVVTNSNECDFASMVEKFTDRLHAREYPQRLIASIVSGVSFTSRQQCLSGCSSRKANNRGRSVVAVPYGGVVSYK